MTRIDYTWVHCIWCQKTMYTDEASTGYIDPITELPDPSMDGRCSFCVKYDTWEEVQEAYALLIAIGMNTDNLWWL